MKSEAVYPELDRGKLSQVKSPVMRRIIESGRKPVTTLTLDELRKIRQFFADHPESMFVYVFYDGRLIEEEEYKRRMTSRTAQLVAIAYDGIPVLWSRSGIEFWFGHVDRA